MAGSLHTRVDLVRAKQLVADVFHRSLGEENLAHLKPLLSSGELLAFMRRLSPLFIRKARSLPSPTEPLPLPSGSTQKLFLRSLPGEAQLRAAYEVVYDALCEHLEARGYPVLRRGPGWVEVYQSKGAPNLVLEAEWGAYLENAFSFEGLARGLLPLLNSVRLAPRGISAPKVPVPSLGARDFLAAWYLANLLTVKERLEWREGEIAYLEQQAGAAQGREGERLLRQLKDRRSKQENELKKYAQALAKYPQEGIEGWEEVKGFLGGAQDDVWKLLSWLDPKNPEGPSEIKRLAPYLSRFSAIARQQLSTAVANKFTTILRELLRLLHLSEPEVRLPSLVATQPFLLQQRGGGDRGNICYGCGWPLGGKEKRITASKLVLSAPSQRLQSGVRQEEPPVCDTCAALSLLSPLKPGEGSVLVRLGDYSSAEAASHFARSLVTGSLHLAAGRYIQLNSPRVEGKPLVQSYGRLHYALLFLGDAVNPKVLRHFPIYLVEGSGAIRLPKRALWLSHLFQRAFQPRPEEEGRLNRDLGNAMRHAFDGLPWHGLYVLARRYGEAKDRLALDKGLGVYPTLLEEEEMLERDEGGKRAQRFRDVAGLVGLLYAWTERVVRVVSSAGAERDGKRALSKLWEKLDNPNSFLYAAAYELDNDKVRLFESGGAFFYQEASRLLKEAQAGVAEREDSGRYLEVTQDALQRVYAHLAERYPHWEDFIYEVQLGLAARFPKYIRMERGETNG